MKTLTLTILLTFISLTVSAQILQYNPQGLYDSPGSLYDKDSLRTVYINFENPGYHALLVDSFLVNPSARIPATITFNGVTTDSAGVRYKGNSTFCLPNDNGVPKVPYNIDMNFWRPNQQLMGYNKMKLANAWLDPTFAKEITASSIYRKYIPTIETSLMKLDVQGNYLGLYVNTESINRQFLKKHFNENDGPLFKCDNANMFCGPNVPTAFSPSLSWLGNDSTTYYDTYDMKTLHGWDEMLDLIYTLNFTPQDLDTILNIDRVLWAFAVNTVVANYDAYNGRYIHNYYLYQSEDGLFQMLPWDLSESFIGALLGNDIGSPTNDPSFDDPYNGDSDPSRPLTNVLLNNPLYRDQFTAHIRTVINELSIPDLTTEINDLQALGYNAASADPNKMFNMVQYTSNVTADLAYIPWGGYGFGGILSTLNKRIPFLNSHPEISLLPPEINNLELNDSLLTVEVLNGTFVDVMATISPYNSRFKAFAMSDDGLNGDLLAGDGIYTSALPYLASQQPVKFYIRAQNSNAMKLSPVRAEYEFYYYLNLPDEPPVVETPTILIYPNPTSTFITVSSDKYPLDYSLISYVGQIVEEGTITSIDDFINLSEYASNVYFLRFDDSIHKVLKVD